MSEDWKGYRDPTLTLLKQHDARVWSRVTMQTSRGAFEGLILPRSETADAEHVVLKLDNGYNVGIRHDTEEELLQVERRVVHFRVHGELFAKCGDERFQSVGRQRRQRQATLAAFFQQIVHSPVRPDRAVVENGNPIAYVFHVSQKM